MTYPAGYLRSIGFVRTGFESKNHSGIFQASSVCADVKDLRNQSMGSVPNYISSIQPVGFRAVPKWFDRQARHLLWY